MTKPVTAFKWNKNGPNHINGPGGFVLCNYDPRNRNLLDIPKPDKFRWVVYGGNMVQICGTEKSAKEFVVETMKAIHDEYRKA